MPNFVKIRSEMVDLEAFTKFAWRHMEVIYGVRQKKTPLNKYQYFWYSSIFFTQFSEIILHTICIIVANFMVLSFIV